MNKLKYWRMKKGMTITQLADKSGINKMTICFIESGKRDYRKVFVETYIKLAKALNIVNYTALIGERKNED